MMSRVSPRGLIVAASRSGAGKTTLTLGLIRALRARGVAVQPFKCGPDYIDPAFHSAAAGRTSVNLDTWAMRPQLIQALIATCAQGADLCLVEGAMGLFDGAAEQGQCGSGSAADLAALTGWPVILVLDVAAQAETAAAVALGCKTYRPDVALAGVVLNSVAGERHAHLVSRAIAALGIPLLGALGRGQNLTLPERHLGLVQAGETSDLEPRLEGIAAAIAKSISLDAVVASAQPLWWPEATPDPDAAFAALKPPGQRIALAQDRAFSFVYPHILAAWRRAGAAILPFSPLGDEEPDASCDAVWLPGGYPELHAPAIARAGRFKSALRSAASRGVAIHGECGGYMVLGSGLEAEDGSRYEMAGLLGLETSYASRRLHLGYRRARYLGTGESMIEGEALGHEFHYATTLSSPDAPLAEIRDAAGTLVAESGARRGSVTGTFFHLIDRAP